MPSPPTRAKGVGPISSPSSSSPGALFSTHTHLTTRRRFFGFCGSELLLAAPAAAAAAAGTTGGGGISSRSRSSFSSSPMTAVMLAFATEASSFSPFSSPRRSRSRSRLEPFRSFSFSRRLRSARRLRRRRSPLLVLLLLLLLALSLSLPLSLPLLLLLLALTFFLLLSFLASAACGFSLVSERFSRPNSSKLSASFGCVDAPFLPPSRSGDGDGSQINGIGREARCTFFSRIFLSSSSSRSLRSSSSRSAQRLRGGPSRDAP